MKRLTINDIATASLRTGKRAYLSLAIGIFLSIFLVTSLFLAVQGVNLAQRKRMAKEIGSQDIILFEAGCSVSEIENSGLHERVGQVYVTARMKETDKFYGWYDETALELLNRRLIEGRMPENPGEIAVEQHILDALRSEAGVGGEVTIPLTAVDGMDEERSFTVTGILHDQSEELSDTWYSGVTMVNRFPAMIVCPEEAPMKTGRTVRHYLLTMKKGADRFGAMEYWDGRSDVGNIAAISMNGYLVFEPVKDNLLGMTSVTAICLYAMAIALMIACCVGIAQSMESQLSRKVDQIGMLRAVGATRRQIRKIFGREAWLLALILSPLSVAAGCGFVYLASLILPEGIIFQFDAKLIALVALVSMVCILLASGLPLRRACRIQPMRVIRDTAMLRKVGRIRSRKQFNAPHLIAGRQIRLHWSRQIGSSVLVMLMLVCVGVAVRFGFENMGGRFLENEDFYISFESGEVDAFMEIQPSASLTENDLNQMRALPHVEKLEMTRQLHVNVHIEGELPEYLKNRMVNHSNDHVEEMYEADADGLLEGIAEHKAALEGFGVEGSLAQMRLMVVSSELVGMMNDYAVSGEVDMDAVNAGREILVNAPTVYRRLEVERSGFSHWLYDTGTAEQMKKWGYEPFLCNDAFAAGQPISLIYAWYTGENGNNWFTKTWTAEEYADLERADAQSVIGAVVDLSAGGEAMWRLDMPCLITTEEGAKAMGLPLKVMDEMMVYLDGDVDQATEEYLASRLYAIAERGNVWNFYNYIETAREDRRLQLQLIMALVGMAIVFFAVSFSLIAGNVKRRIRADERMIGTLRAVGADKRALVSCYRDQVGLTVVMGFALAVIACLVIIIIGVQMTFLNFAAAAGAMIVFAVCCYGLSLMTVSKAVQETVNRSIVENIREL